MIASGDTLNLAFSDCAPSGLERDWYLVLDGMPLTAEVAAMRARPAQQDPVVLPIAFRLHPNTPNPFRRMTRIACDLPTPGVASVEIFDAQGRLVQVMRGWFAAGRVSWNWDQRDRSGRAVGAGIYAYRVKWNGREASAKMVVLP